MKDMLQPGTIRALEAHVAPPEPLFVAGGQRTSYATEDREKRFIATVDSIQASATSEDGCDINQCLQVAGPSWAYRLKYVYTDASL